jgi:putative ABC transport system ATP-binding protein
MNIVSLQNLDFAFGAGALRNQILYDVNLDIAAGEIVLLTGPSGSGKTTLLTLMGALRSAQSGSINVLNQELRGASAKQLAAVRRHIGYIFQAHNLLNSLTARQNVLMSLELHHELAGQRAYEMATTMLQQVGLGDRLDYYPAQLSGGQKQRVAIARALAAQPKLVLADEPTAALDSKSGRDVVDILQRLARERGVPILMVTHDGRVLDIADRVLAMEDGRLKK